MRQLLPVAVEAIDPVTAYRDDERRGTADQPWLALNMVTSLDGATAVDGASAALSSPADRIVFHALRAIADIILVGAGTWRAEGYRPPRTSEADQRWRVAQGRPAFPRIAVVSGRLDLDPTTPFFTDTPSRPLVVTTAAADPERARVLGELADVVIAGESLLDPVAMLAALGAAGADVVLCEGGPTINGSLVQAGLVDEMCLTLAPQLVSGLSDRAIIGPSLVATHPLALRRVLEDDGNLLLRYARDARA